MSSSRVPFPSSLGRQALELRPHRATCISTKARPATQFSHSTRHSVPALLWVRFSGPRPCIRTIPRETSHLQGRLRRTACFGAGCTVCSRGPRSLQPVLPDQRVEKKSHPVDHRVQRRRTGAPDGPSEGRLPKTRNLRTQCIMTRISEPNVSLKINTAALEEPRPGPCTEAPPIKTIQRPSSRQSGMTLLEEPCGDRVDRLLRGRLHGLS
ncbi:hypothetical protein M885DRAFT_73934 [Pelagophyceae sp. CCMP2097]|nr:hypothetical protein M885DRAFT_73934 [Pelagophyceae sp. CCMP2097]